MQIRPIHYLLAFFAVGMVSSTFYFNSLREQLKEKSAAGHEPDKPIEDILQFSDEEARQYHHFLREQEQAGNTTANAAKVIPQTSITTAEPVIRKNISDTLLQRRLDSLPVLPRRTVIIGRPIPFEVSIPAGWKMLSWNKPVTAVVNHRSIINLEIGPWTSSLDEYAKLTVKAMQERYPRMSLAGEENILIDGKTWKHIVLRGPVTEENEDHEVSIVVHGSRRGSYRFLVEGDRADLERDATDITLMLTSFRFPPDNYEPEDASGVRVYVNGERVDY